MASESTLRFHSVHGQVELSQGNTRAQCVKPSDWYPRKMEFIGGWGGCYGCEVVFSSRPLVLGELICLRLGPKLYSTRTFGLAVLYGVTNRDPNYTRQVPSAYDIKKQDGYWVLQQFTNNESSVRFFVNASRDLLSYDREGNIIKGTNLGKANGSLWAVVVVPAYPFFVDIESALPRANTAAASDVAVPSSTQREAPTTNSSRRGAPGNSFQEAAVSTQTPIQNQSSAPKTASSTSEKRQGQQSTSSFDRRDRGMSECIICCDNTADSAFAPCGHVHSCYICALDQWQGRGEGNCPTCRKQIDNVLRIYIN